MAEINNKCPKCKKYSLVITPFYDEPNGKEIWCSNYKDKCDFLLINEDCDEIMNTKKRIFN